MSKIFYDHLIVLEEVETEIKNIAQSPEEKEELWKLVDDIVHHRVMISILNKLPIEYHDEFLTRFREAPHHDSHIDFLNDKIATGPEEEDIEEIIKREVKTLEKELLQEIRSLKEKK